MRIKIAIAALLAVIFAVAGVTLASADSDDPRHDEARVIKLFTVTTQFAFVDADSSGETAPTLGDQFVFSDDVFDRKGGTELGITGVVCTVVRLEPTDTPTEATIQCQATIRLEGGQIAIQGLVTTPTSDDVPPPFELAITGGTGDFEGASGHVTVEDLNDTEANLTVVLSDD